MKNLTILLKIAFILLVSLLLNCTSLKNTSKGINNPNESPEKVMLTVFNAAKNKDFKLLPQLLPPEGEGTCDGDCKALCNPGNEEMRKKLAHNYMTKDDFIKYFSNAKIIGTTVIEGKRARVKFTFGQNNELDEVMNMQMIEGKWYLESF